MAEVSKSGPLFDGVAAAEIDKYCHKLEKDLADEALDELQSAFRDTFKHSTGYYESHVHVTSDPDGSVVTDGGIVYGPWLEGTGSRNFPKTRFRGYALFRRIRDAIQSKAADKAEEEMPELIERIG